MSMMGITIRSAKMKAITPPKLMPLFHNTAASGTLPTEQTNEMIAMNGPTIGPQNFENSGWELRKNDRQKLVGTNTASAPAIRRPPATSFETDNQSMTK